MNSIGGAGAACDTSFYCLVFPARKATHARTYGNVNDDRINLFNPTNMPNNADDQRKY